MNNDWVIRRCQNCGGTKREHRGKRCPTRLKVTEWKPWTVAEYEAAEAAELSADDDGPSCDSLIDGQTLTSHDGRTFIVSIREVPKA